MIDALADRYEAARLLLFLQVDAFAPGNDNATSWRELGARRGRSEIDCRAAAWEVEVLSTRRIPRD